jgi:hypothetical protein
VQEFTGGCQWYVSNDPAVGDWLKKFIVFEGNPRVVRIIAKISPYSPTAIQNYHSFFNAYLKKDTLMRRHIRDLEQTDMLEFMSVSEKSGCARRKAHCRN